MNPAETNWAARVAMLQATLGREPTLQELIMLTRTYVWTPEEFAAQRTAFARAETAFGKDAAEAAYRLAVKNGDLEEVERLDAEVSRRLDLGPRGIMS